MAEAAAALSGIVVVGAIAFIIVALGLDIGSFRLAGVALANDRKSAHGKRRRAEMIGDAGHLHGVRLQSGHASVLQFGYQVLRASQPSGREQPQAVTAV